MKPWEDEKTIREFQRMSPNKSLKYAAELIKFSLKILYFSIKEEHPRWKSRRIREEMEKILFWE